MLGVEMAARRRERTEWPRASRPEALSRRALIAGAGGVAGAALVRADPAGAQLDATTDDAVGLNVKDFGASANGVDDDAPAFQAVLNQLAAMGGGTLVFPPGQYVLASPVQRVFGNAASAVILRGHGSASPVLVKGGSNTALLLGGIESLLMEDMVFVGTPGVFPDVATVLRLNSCLVATLRNCHFYGIAVSAPGSAVVYAHTTDLHLETCAFRGSTGNQYHGVPVVMVENWLGLSVEDTEFIDFGTLNGVGHSKTPQPAGGWVRVGSTPRLLSTAFQRGVYLRNVKMDEGSFYGLAVTPNPAVSARIAQVEIDNLMVNVAHPSPGIGALIDFTDRVTVRDSWFGFTTDVVRPAIDLRRVGTATLDHIVCTSTANLIKADAETRSLTIIESEYATLSSAAGVTTIVKDGAQVIPILTLRTKAGTPSDRDFPRPPPDGTLAVDTAGEKLYVRVAGAWKSAALTGPPVFSPPHIPGLKAWFKAEDIKGIPGGGPVGSWGDSSGVGTNLLQSAAARQPTLVQNVLNGRPVVRFDGVDDFLVSAPFVPAMGQPNTVFLVGQMNRPSNGDAFFDAGSAALGTAVLIDTNGVDFRMYAGANVYDGRADTRFHVFSAKFDKTLSVFGVDGIRRSGNCGQAVFSKITLGSRTDGSVKPLSGDIAEVIVYNAALTPEQIDEVEYHLRIKYGLL